jgi:apolipoprotein D and lipocalin family protein
MKTNILWLVLLLSACSSNENLLIVNSVDLEKYTGKWYEIARLPQSFEKNCACVTAEYAILSESKVEVKNTCWDTTSNKFKVSEGAAKPIKDLNNAGLSVQFFWPFSGGYYVMALDSNYKYALIGNPNRKYLWILSRTPSLEKSRLDSLKSIAEKNGYDLSSLIETEHFCQNKE